VSDQVYLANIVNVSYFKVLLGGLLPLSNKLNFCRVCIQCKDSLLVKKQVNCKI